MSNPTEESSTTAAAASSSKTQETKEQKDDKPKNLIQVSNKFPVFRFVGTARRMLAEGEPIVELGGLGNAIGAVVSVSEILKSQKLVEITKIETSTVEVQGRGTRTTFVPKLSIHVKKSDQFDALEAQRKEEQEKKSAAAAAASAEAAAESKESKETKETKETKEAK